MFRITVQRVKDSSNWKLAIHMKWTYFVPISNGILCQNALNSFWQHHSIKGYTINWFNRHHFRLWQMIQIWKFRVFISDYIFSLLREILNGCDHSKGSSFHISSTGLCRKGVNRLGTVTRNGSSFGRWWKCVQHVKRPSCGPYHHTLLIENKVYSIFLSSSKEPPRSTCFFLCSFSFFHKQNLVIKKWLQSVRRAK